MLYTERGQRAGCFADTPFHGMNAKGPIGDVCYTEIFAAGQNVFNTERYERTQGDLKRPASDIDISSPIGPGMQVNPVTSNAYRILELRGSIRTSAIRDVEFRHGAFSEDSP
jgi:hypothetical protein